ncbi:TIGR02302 family protein [Hansschlegelia zhihuaiae]|uniref:TIGR02302 family protein n=1 Tax=Hansschlegelia zhihuaiae TaxID=405005 RepID=A0A4Q0MCA6_9HYPH|nr:TIGR02302 family protein [Hansschlegelia zhihuaiae]RXF70824.1 TIGR02302 family protein [Hansschlegelia zhihuaiae]
MTGSDGTDGRGRALIERVVARARLALVWEGVWPWIAAASAVVALFLAVSWFGVWDALPPQGRIAGVVAFGLAFVASLAPLVRAALPDRRSALGRVDRASGVAHRPATSLDDRLASVAGEDPMTRALWAAHRERMERDAGRLKAGRPSPRLAARDPYALRFLLALVAVVAFAVAGSDRGARVLAAFDWTTPAAETAPARLDAWVAPPGYTGRPPIFLTARAAGAGQNSADARAAAIPEGEQDAVSVPENATLVVRGSGGAVEVTATGAAEAIPVEGRPPEGVVERRFKLTGDAEARVAAAGAPDRVWRFRIIPDEPPSIALTGPLKLNARGTAIIPYELRDDYGVASAEARFVLKDEAAAKAPRFSRSETTDGPAAERRPLYEAPKVPLGLPRAKARDGKADTPLDVMEHPFAGAEAVMTLAARDEAGQEGLSKSIDMRLPARSFTKPLARALVEQRRILAMDANAKPRVLTAIRALAMFPEEFIKEASVYLGVTTAYRRLEIAVSDDELREAADYLWEVALRIEDGDLPEAERDLRAAEEALRKALENGASEEEIKKLTQDLRAALEKFMREMAEQQRRNPGQQQAQPGERGKAVRPQDLRDMVDKMEKLAQSGAKDAAKQALADLKNMLDNLQNAQRQQADPNAQAQQQQLNKLQDMIREQGKLRDQTFQQYRQNERQQRNQRGQQGRRQQQQEGSQGEQRMRDLAEQQKQLRDRLDQMMKEQGQQGEQAQRGEGQQQPGQRQGRQQPGGEQGEGQQPGQEGQGGQDGKNALGEAGKSMGEAQGSLGQGQTGQALDHQQKALEQLRKGAQAMAEAMQKGQGQPGQQGEEGQQGAQNGEEGRDDDPLGRPVRRRESDGDATKVPGEIDAQRARRVLEELRKRLGEADRPREELDYLERLLAP